MLVEGACGVAHVMELRPRPVEEDWKKVVEMGPALMQRAQRRLPDLLLWLVETMADLAESKSWAILAVGIDGQQEGCGCESDGEGVRAHNLWGS